MAAAPDAERRALFLPASRCCCCYDSIDGQQQNVCGRTVELIVNLCKQHFASSRWKIWHSAESASTILNCCDLLPNVSKYPRVSVLVFLFFQWLIVIATKHIGWYLGGHLTWSFPGSSFLNRNERLRLLWDQHPPLRPHPTPQLWTHHLPHLRKRRADRRALWRSTEYKLSCQVLIRRKVGRENLYNLYLRLPLVHMSCDWWKHYNQSSVDCA